MKAKRSLLLVLAILASQPIYAQWRLLFRSQDIQQTLNLMTLTDSANSIMAIESRGVLSKYLIVRYSRSKRKLVAKDSIWGFVDGNGAIWRCYEKELFLVINSNRGWVNYAINRPVGTRLTAMYGARMYSRTLDSKIKSNWSEAMADIPQGYILR
ncbi:hypothetical protein [Spirosoma flavum]|uniref:Uncharacterized protein n=1 Tax=Spirosoma flavum TaxID=2048557 RepID=A0ABW6AP28_9BACT